MKARSKVVCPALQRQLCSAVPGSTTTILAFSCTPLPLHLQHSWLSHASPDNTRLAARQPLWPRTAASHLPVYRVFISLESVVNRWAHTGGHGVGVGRVRVLVRVQLGPMVEVHRLHGPGAVRIPVHGGRDAHPVHPVVGQVFVLHTDMRGTRQICPKVCWRTKDACVSYILSLFVSWRVELWNIVSHFKNR